MPSSRRRPPPAAPATVPDLPLHELLALEAVARLGAVQAAAEALHVTPSGISHRLASLAQRIGEPLLQRRGRGIELTAVALRYIETLRPGLLGLAEATEALRAAERQVVRIATAPAIGAAWLLPRLQHGIVRQRDLRLELLSVATADELPPDRWDILVHYGPLPRGGAARRLLFTETLIRVGAPGWRARLASGEPVPELRLAQLEVPAPGGAPRRARSAAPARLVFDDALAMLEAAAAGAGAAWTTETAAGPHLAQGALVRLGRDQQSGDRYGAVLSEAGALKPLAAACWRWLVEEAAG